MANRNNYQYEKRQKELAKQKKKEEKRQKKERKNQADSPPGTENSAPTDGPPR